MQQINFKNINQPVIIVGSRNHQETITGLAEANSICRSDQIVFAPQDGVEVLREKISGLLLKPHSSEFRLFVVLEADCLNGEQANTLLKTLEEPPAYAKIILFANSLGKILPTIKSRCQKYILKSSNDEAGSDDFFTGDFNEFVKKINKIEIDVIPGILETTLKSLRSRLDNKEAVEFYKKVSTSYVMALNTNVNRKLLLEKLFIYRKTMSSK